MKKTKEFLIKFVSSFGYLGYAPIASGTVGSLAGFVICLFVRNNPLALISVTVLVIAVGFCVCTEAEHVFKEKDSHKIVIDEVAGYLVTMCFLPHITIGTMVIGFFLSRIFDILKPYPIRKLEEIHGGVGVMLDDILAGIYANIFLRVIIILLKV